MREVPFLEACDIQGGTQPPKSTFKQEPCDNYVRLLQIRDFKSDDSPVYVPVARNLKTCDESDIMIARYGASIGRVLQGKSGAYNVALVKTIPNDEIVNRPYLKHYLRSPRFQSYILGLGGRAAQAGFNKNDLERTTIPLPPLDEQKRIAAILDQADALRRLRQRAVSIFERTKTALFHQMFSQSADKKPLGSIIKVGSGNGLTAKDMRGGDVPVYGGNGINGWHDEGFVDPQTVIIGRVGVYCGAVHITDRNAWVTDNALIVKKLIDIETDYLAEALRVANLNQYAGRSAQPLVSGSRIYPIEIPVPPIEEQRQFTSKIAAMAGPRQELQRGLETIETLFDSLQQRAFSGEL